MTSLRVPFNGEYTIDNSYSTMSGTRITHGMMRRTMTPCLRRAAAMLSHRRLWNTRGDGSSGITGAICSKTEFVLDRDGRVTTAHDAMNPIFDAIYEHLYKSMERSDEAPDTIWIVRLHAWVIIPETVPYTKTTLLAFRTNDALARYLKSFLTTKTRSETVLRTNHKSYTLSPARGKIAQFAMHKLPALIASCNRLSLPPALYAERVLYTTPRPSFPPIQFIPIDMHIIIQHLISRETPVWVYHELSSGCTDRIIVSDDSDSIAEVLQSLTSSDSMGPAARFDAFLVDMQSTCKSHVYDKYVTARAIDELVSRISADKANRTYSFTVTSNRRRDWYSKCTIGRISCRV